MPVCFQLAMMEPARHPPGSSHVQTRLGSAWTSCTSTEAAQLTYPVFVVHRFASGIFRKCLQIVANVSLRCLFYFLLAKYETCYIPLKLWLYGSVQFRLLLVLCRCKWCLIVCWYYALSQENVPTLVSCVFKRCRWNLVSFAVKHQNTSINQMDFLVGAICHRRVNWRRRWMAVSGVACELNRWVLSGFEGFSRVSDGSRYFVPGSRCNDYVMFNFTFHLCYPALLKYSYQQMKLLGRLLMLWGEPVA